MTLSSSKISWVTCLTFVLLLVTNSAVAQSVNLDFGEGGSATARIVQLVVLLTVITLAPSILLMVTSFARIVIVLSLLRTALGTQGAPPNSIVISLALFLTFFIMQPTLENAYNNGAGNDNFIKTWHNIT